MIDDSNNKKIDANAIVSPRNTEKLYGNEELDVPEVDAGQSDETPASLPDEVDDVNENMFPSAD